MTPEQVDKMLADYKHCVARSKHIEIELSIMERQYQQSTATMMQDEALKAVQYDGMPHGTDVGKPTENLVMRFMSGYVPKYIEELAGDIHRLNDELFEMRTVVRIVDSWLLALTDKELFVLKRHVIENCFWKEVLEEYEAKWGIFSKEGLRKIKKKALAKVYEAAE